MKIERIAIHNFKCFEGTNAINALSDGHAADKPIILIGGLNGAGKTTIVEALLLCLYGKRNKTLWPSKGAPREDYENYVLAVTNKDAKTRSLRPELWIEISLTGIELGGIPHSLSLKRSWVLDASTNSIWNEALTLIDEKGGKFGFVSEENWEDFIDELIPYDISQFFFFDGEKIQDFVKDEDRAFAESLEKVLGISLYERLKADLGEVRRRILGDYKKNEEINIRIADFTTEIAKTEKNIREHREGVEQLKEGIRQIEERIEAIDIETRRITRTHAESLYEFESEKEKLLKEKGAIEERIFEAIQENLPFVITAPLGEAVLDQLNKEQQLKEFWAMQRALQPKIKLISEKVFQDDNELHSLSEEGKNYYIEKLTRVLEEVLTEKPRHLEEVDLLHDLAKNDVDRIYQKIQSTHGIVHSLSTHLNGLQEIEPKLKTIAQMQQKSDDPEVARLYEERGKLKEQIEFKKQEIDSLNVEIAKLESAMTSMKKQRTEFERQAAKTVEMQAQMDYCDRMRAVLDDFSHQLRAQKVEQLQDLTLQMWHNLAHKKDHVKEIVISPNRQFSIELYDPDHKLLDKTKLSAGEKEILAISIIWALSQLAEHSLPIVIDTPLGRLDTIHRANIAQKYFPNASHQVILLSTNTELVGKEYYAIKPFVGKQYLIQRHQQKKASQIVEGYFE